MFSPRYAVCRSQSLEDVRVVQASYSPESPFCCFKEKVEMDDETLLEFFCYDEALTPSLDCPLCMGRLFRSLEDAIYTCDTCDKEFTVSDDPLKDVV